MGEFDIKAEKIYVVGDIHAEFPKLNKWIKDNSPEVVLACGDFGWWPHFHATTGLFGEKRKLFDQFGIVTGDSKIFWCDGNHENHDDLRSKVLKYGRVPIEIMPNVYYCPRGSIISINGLNYLFFGGATSIDKNMRVPGQSWWPGENISEADLASIPDVKIDTVISHAAPDLFKFNKWVDSDKDYNRKALDVVFEQTKPKKWFFGHYHMRVSGKSNNCYFRGLSSVVDVKTFAYKI